MGSGDPTEVLDPEAIAAYEEIAQERGEEIKIPESNKPTTEEPKEEIKEEAKEEVTDEPLIEDVTGDNEEESTETEETGNQLEGINEDSEEEGTTEESEEEKEEVTPEQLEEQIRSMAIDEGLNIEEAKIRYEGRQGILTKYERNPDKLAKAFQSTQSAYDKLKAEHEKTLTTPKYDEVAFNIQAEKARIPAYVQKNREDLIAQARDKSPRKTENMDDDDILNAIIISTEDNVDAKYEGKVKEVKQSAVTRRVELLREVSESDREFIPEVKAMIDNTDDSHIVSPAFDIQDLVKFVRGTKYTPEYIKQVKDEWFKKGQSDTKIVGEKRPSKQPSSKTKKEPVTGTGKSLTQKQQHRAVEMFPDESEKNAFEMFKDVYESDLKKNPNFVTT